HRPFTGGRRPSASSDRLVPSSRQTRPPGRAPPNGRPASARYPAPSGPKANPVGKVQPSSTSTDSGCDTRLILPITRHPAPIPPTRPTTPSPPTPPGSGPDPPRPTSRPPATAPHGTTAP